MNPVYATMATTIFEEMSALARETGAINLGQGFPDSVGPTELLQAAAEAVLAGPNQYPPSSGLPILREAVAAHYRRFQSLDIGAQNVLVTSGATEAIAAALLAIVSAGDEVILFEPMYDAYRPLIERAGGVARAVTLQPPDWRLPIGDVAAAIGPRTRAIVLNNPNNPAARVFTREELQALAALCVAHDLIAICDEVWEHVIFDQAAHVPMIGLPGMAERAVKIGSAGKIFGLTGWKVGFVIASPGLLQPIARAHQFLTFTTPPCLQIAVAHGLGLDDDFFIHSRAALERSRDYLVALLTRAGFTTLPSQGTYFVTVDLNASGICGDGDALARRMVHEAGVASIPLSPFYISSLAPPGLVRLCFAKPDDVLAEAGGRLGKWLADQRAASHA
ncbi:aminotransferase [uncultured Sphingomonas sp.]|uniref:aminotransferase n=1 Tax=uncultured Sphingomonas sp. TaxID=158754 RepID=UPI0026305247|nr:aminotransferase [uncultured Sphingomonas sp.]